MGLLSSVHQLNSAWMMTLALAGLTALYVLALDQGLVLGVVQGAAAFDQNLIHEFLHDGRHLLGMPCH